MTNFYFTDRKFNLINIVSSKDTTILFDVAEDVQSIEESARVFQGTITIDESKQTIENWNKASDMTSVGNYILYKDRQNESVFITIESQDADPVDFTIDIVGHDAGIDLINEIVEPWIPDKAYTVKEYIEKATWDSGFEIGINEAPNLSRKLTGWQSTDDTALKRILAIAQNFDVELDFSFDVSGLDVVRRYINIYRKRGTDDNVTLYVDKELEKIVTKKDIFDLCTSIKAEGGEDDKTKKNITLKGYKWTDPDKRFTLNDDGILRDTETVQLWSRLLSNENPNPIHHHIQRYMKYETKDKATLLANALRDLKKRSQVAVNYEVDILEFPSLVKIGDTIKLVDEKRSLYLSARVLKLTYDYVTERAMATLGDYLIQEGRISTSLADLANELKGRVSDVNGRIDKMGMYAAYANSADGITDFSRELEEPPQLYIGYSILDSDNPEDFTWSLYRGKDGKDGKGVESGKVEYQAGTSGTNPPTGAWLNNPPSVEPGQYLWSRTTLTYTDGTKTIGYTVGRMGMNGTGGVGIKQVDIEYQSGSSGTTPPTGKWSTTIPSVSANQYLWTRKVTTLTNDEKTTEYNVGKMGADGADAQLLYLTATAENMAFTADDTAKPNQVITISAKLQNVSGTVTYKAVPYIGNQAQTPISLTGSGNDRTLDSSNWTNKDWSLIAITANLGNLSDTLSVVKVKDGAKGDKGVKGDQGLQGLQGAKGDQGIKGATGADGKSSYTHIAYANSSDGKTNFSTSDSNRSYVGMYVDFNQTDSTDPTKYKWTKVEGDKGDQGIPGKEGTDGKTPYFHTAWADSSDGKTNFSTTASLGKKYIGTYTDFTQNDSVNPATYQWTELVGALEIGGRNLLIGSKTPTVLNPTEYETYNITITDTEYQGATVYKLNGKWSRIAIRIDPLVDRRVFEDGAIYELSAYFKKDFADDLNIWANISTIGNNTIINTDEVTNRNLKLFGTDWIRLRILFRLDKFLPGGSMRFNFEPNNPFTGNLWTAGLAFKKTSIKTNDWSPAPEDQVNKSDYDSDKAAINNRFTALAIPLVQSAQPTTKIEGQQWWRTDSLGNVTGYFVYKNGKWVAQTIQQSVLNIVTLNAVTITGSTITGTTISGSEFKSSGEYMPMGMGNVTLQYDTSIKGLYKMNWKVKGSTQSGQTMLDPIAISSWSGSGGWSDLNNAWKWRLDNQGMKVFQGMSGSEYGTNGIKITDDSLNQAVLDINDLGVNEPQDFGKALGLYMSPDFAVYGTSGASRCQYSRNLRTVQLTGALRNKVDIPGSYDSIWMFTLPVGLRPSRTLNFRQQGSFLNTYLMTIESNGDVKMSRYGTTSATTCPSGSWLNINCSFHTSEDYKWLL